MDKTPEPVGIKTSYSPPFVVVVVAVGWWRFLLLIVLVFLTNSKKLSTSYGMTTGTISHNR